MNKYVIVAKQTTNNTESTFDKAILVSTLANAKSILKNTMDDLKTSVENNTSAIITNIRKSDNDFWGVIEWSEWTHGTVELYSKEFNIIPVQLFKVPSNAKYKVEHNRYIDDIKVNPESSNDLEPPVYVTKITDAHKASKEMAKKLEGIARNYNDPIGLTKGGSIFRKFFYYQLKKPNGDGYQTIMDEIVIVEL